MNAKTHGVFRIVIFVGLLADDDHNWTPSYDPNGAGLTSVMAHEEGHPFGLADWPTAIPPVMVRRLWVLAGSTAPDLIASQALPHVTMRLQINMVVVLPQAQLPHHV